MKETPSKHNHYIVLSIFAYLAAVFLGTGTYDISVRLSPPFVSFLLFSIPRELIGVLGILFVDGLYILLDGMLAKFRTRSTRTAALYFMVALLVIMASANVMSAVINNQVEGLGGFSWVMYGVKFGAIMYLAFYVYARWQDPFTQHEIIGIELSEVMDKEINAHEKNIGKKLGVAGGEVVALQRQFTLYEMEFQKRTGKDIRIALGSGWRRAVATMSGIYIPDGFVFEGEDSADAGSAGSRTGKRKTPQVIDLDAGNAGTSHIVDPIVPPEEVVNAKGGGRLQTLLKKVGVGVNFR